MFPLFLIVKRDKPDLEAVKRSPTPVLSTRRAAKEVCAETEATGCVPARAVEPKRWKVAETVACEPKRKSSVVLFAAIIPPFTPVISAKGEFPPPPPVKSVWHWRFPLASVLSVQLL